MDLPERAARIADAMPRDEAAPAESHVAAWTAVYESALSHLKVARQESRMRAERLIEQPCGQPSHDQPGIPRTLCLECGGGPAAFVLALNAEDDP